MEFEARKVREPLIFEFKVKTFPLWVMPAWDVLTVPFE